MKNRIQHYMIRQLSYHVFIIGFILSMSIQASAQTEFLKKYNSDGHHMGGGSVNLVNDKMTDQRQNGFVFALSPFNPTPGIMTNGSPAIFTTDLNGEFDGLMKQYLTDPFEAETKDVSILAMKAGTIDEGYFIYGDQTDGSHNYFIRTNTAGIVLWSNELQIELTGSWLDTDLENVLAIQLQDGNILVAGAIDHSTNTTTTAEYSHDLFVMKLDKNTGNIIWKNLIQSTAVTDGFMPRDVIETTPGQYYIVGGGPDSAIASEFEEFIMHIEDFGTSISADLRIFPFPGDVQLSSLLYESESSKLTVSGHRANGGVYNHIVSFRIGTDLSNFESMSGTLNAFSRYDAPVNIALNDAIYLNDRLNIYFYGDNTPIDYLSNGILVLGNDGSIINTKIGEEYPFTYGAQIYQTDDALYTTSLIRELGLPFFDHFRLNRWSTLGNTCIENPYNIVQSENGLSPYNGVPTIHPVSIEYIPLAVVDTTYIFTKEDLCLDCDSTAADVGPITTSTGDSSLCDIASILLYAPTGMGYSYQWFKDGILIVGAISSTITATEGGEYTVVITDEVGCSFELKIEITPGVDVSDIDGMIYCLSFSFPLPDYGDGGSWSGPAVIEAGGSYYFSPLSLGSYVLTYCDGLGCCADAIITVQSPEIEILDLTGVCEDDNSGSITATVDGGLYDWTLRLDGVFYDEELGVDIVTFSSLSAGDYELIVTDSEGCKSSYKFTITSGGWHKQTVNTTGTESANDVVTDAFGNVYVVGTFSNTTEIEGGGNPNILVDSDGAAEGMMYLAKYDDCGTLLWAAHATGTTLCSGEGLILDELNGMVYVAGDLKNTAVFHCAESAGDLCVSGYTETVSAPTSKSGYIAQYDMNTGCLYFANVYSDGDVQSTTSITINEGNGKIFVGGSYQLSSTSPKYLFVRKYQPGVASGVLNTLGDIRWAVYDNTSTNLEWNQINNMDYDENTNFLYAIGDFRGGISVLTSTINLSANYIDAFLLTLRDTDLGGSIDAVDVFNLRQGNGSPNGFMTGEGVAVDKATSALYLTGSFNEPITTAFSFSGINALGSFGPKSKSYMLSGHITNATPPWARHTFASPSTSGWVRGRDVTQKDGNVLFCNEFSGYGLSIAPGGGLGTSYGFIGDSTESRHIGVISYSQLGVRNWANVTESSSPYEADDHFVNAISIGVGGNSFMAGAFRNTMSYNFGTPYSGDLLLSGYYGGYNACVLRVKNSSGELKSATSENENESMNSFEFNLYPNPNNGIFKLEIDKSEELTEMSVLDMYGSVVFENTIRETTTDVSLTNLSKGIYFIKLVRGEITRVEKIVIQ